jgi:hypothetical protein
MDPTELPDLRLETHPASGTLCSLEYQMMDEVQRPRNPERYAPLLEPFMIYFEKLLLADPPTSTISITCSSHVQWPVSPLSHSIITILLHTVYLENKALKTSIFWDIILCNLLRWLSREQTHLYNLTSALSAAPQKDFSSISHFPPCNTKSSQDFLLVILLKIQFS